MKIYDMNRGTGKTSLLIQISATRGARIITATENQAKVVKEMAKHMGRNIPEPMSYFSYKEYKGLIKEEILIDELDCLIQYHLFPNTKLIAATRSSSEYPPEYYELNIQGDKL